jgi:hypothetical protein
VPGASFSGILQKLRLSDFSKEKLENSRERIHRDKSPLFPQRRGSVVVFLLGFLDADHSDADDPGKVDEDKRDADEALRGALCHSVKKIANHSPSSQFPTKIL